MKLQTEHLKLYAVTDRSWLGGRTLAQQVEESLAGGATMVQLREKGADITEEKVLEDVLQRDYNDTHRDIAPLRQAEDAVLVDTTALDLEGSYQLLLKTIRERI